MEMHGRSAIDTLANDCNTTAKPMEPRNSVERTTVHFYTFFFRALSDGPPCIKVAAAHLYQSVGAGGIDPHTEEEVQGVIDAIARVNVRWPGTFVPIYPPSPRPDDLAQTLWILDSSALWPVLNTPNQLETVLAVALNRQP